MQIFLCHFSFQPFTYVRGLIGGSPAKRDASVHRKVKGEKTDD